MGFDLYISDRIKYSKTYLISYFFKMAHRHIYRTITRKKPYNTQLQDDLEFVLPMSKHLPFLPLLYITDVCTMLSVLIGNIYFVYIVSLCNDYKLFVYIYIFLPRLLF